MYVVLDGPAVDEQADREGNSGGNGEEGREPDLGTVGFTPLQVALDQLVGHGAEDADADTHAEGGRNEDEPAVFLVSFALGREWYSDG